MEHREGRNAQDLRASEGQQGFPRGLLPTGGGTPGPDTCSEPGCAWCRGSSSQGPQDGPRTREPWGPRGGRAPRDAAGASPSVAVCLENGYPSGAPDGAVAETTLCQLWVRPLWDVCCFGGVADSLCCRLSLGPEGESASAPLPAPLAWSLAHSRRAGLGKWVCTPSG